MLEMAIASYRLPILLPGFPDSVIYSVIGEQVNIELS